MLGNRRNLIFRVSIVINIAVLFYAAMHLSSNTSPSVEWMPFTVDGSERSAEMRYLNRDDGSQNETRPSARNFEETTSQKSVSTIPTTNKTASSTASIAELEKAAEIRIERDNQYPKVNSDFPAVEATNETAVETDENIVTDAALARLREMLQCNDRDFKFETQQRGEFWVLKNYVRADHGPVLCHETITYTTHAGFEFLDNVPLLVERWLSPVSLAIHAPGSDFDPTVNSIRYLRDCVGNDLVQQFVTFHIFFSYKHIPSKIPDPNVLLSEPYNCSLNPPYNVNSSTTYKKQKALLYPVNVARNIARDAALTHYILPSDIELYPSPNLIPKFLNMIVRNKPPLVDSKRPRVFPISLFEVDAKVKVPSSKTELRAMLAKKTAIPFHKYVCPDCHNIPQGQQWMNAEETKQMDVFHVGKRRGKYVHWEPIFIGTHDDPHYDERLSWEGKKDKMTQGYVLCVKDYDFMILNNAFIVHKPGIKRYVRNAKRDAQANRQTSFIKNHIMPELRKLYGTKSGCAL